MRQLQKPELRAATKAQSTPAFWYVIRLPEPRMAWVNMHPVGTFIVMPPTLYSKVRTGVDPTAVAWAAVGAENTRAPVATNEVKSRAKRGLAKGISSGVPGLGTSTGRTAPGRPRLSSPSAFHHHR